NVLKHAQAQSVSVSIGCDEGAGGGSVRVEVADDGVGFEPPKFTGDLSRAGGFGLFNIRERLDYVGGRIEIHSSPGGGTRTILFVPLGRVPPAPPDPAMAP